MRAFCQAEGLSEASFFAWRREIARRDGEGKPPATSRRVRSRPPRKTNGRRQRTGTSQAKTNGRPAFLPVVLDAGHEHDAGSLVLELQGARRLRLPPSIEPARLAAIVHALEAGPSVESGKAQR
ncbi:MAG: hypothetical protein DWQ31_19815 [Planctomycetota bacterium]|nr:MAG: hypothetical protein DWQ31_19815 [Planctomycetota bacterium]